MRSVLCSVGISLAVCFAAGIIYATEIFDSVVRIPYNYTYFESNIFSSFGILGFSLAFDACILLQKITSMWICVFGCIGSTLTFLLLWSTTKSLEFYANRLWLICFYSFLAGHSLSYLYQTALYVCLKSVKKSHWGQLIGALHVPLGMSSFLLTFVAIELFHKKVSYVFVSFAGISALVSFAAILGLRIRKLPKGFSS